jgi:hypothetical protein
VWYKYLTQGLLNIGFIQSNINECVFYQQGTIFLVYVDDGIIAGPSEKDIKQVIINLQATFDVSNKGNLTDYLGVNIKTREDGTFKLSQLHLIDQIIKDANFQANTKYKATPAASTKILNKDISGNIDECIFYQQGTIFLVYVDDGIIAGPSEKDIKQVIINLQATFDVSNKGDLTDYLGVNIKTREDGTFKLLQPHLIDQIIKDANFQANTKYKATPAASTKILNKDISGTPHHPTLHFCGLIGKLKFLKKSTRGELGYVVHQCARFCEEPTELHTDAVHHIVRYLAGTRGEGLILSPKQASFECYADADFCGLWNKETAEHDASTAESRMGYLLTFAQCLLIWASKLAGPYCLSTTEAEYVSLSVALRQVISVMDLLAEMKAQGIVTEEFAPKIFCKVFEDNLGALELA